MRATAPPVPRGSTGERPRRTASAPSPVASAALPGTAVDIGAPTVRRLAAAHGRVPFAPDRSPSAPEPEAQTPSHVGIREPVPRARTEGAAPRSGKDRARLVVGLFQAGDAEPRLGVHQLTDEVRAGVTDRRVRVPGDPAAPQRGDPVPAKVPRGPGERRTARGAIRAARCANCRTDQRSPAKRSFSGRAAPVVSRTRTKVSTPMNSPNLSLPILRKKMLSP